MTSINGRINIHQNIFVDLAGGFLPSTFYAVYFPKDFTWSVATFKNGTHEPFTIAKMSMNDPVRMRAAFLSSSRPSLKVNSRKKGYNELSIGLEKAAYDDIKHVVHIKINPQYALILLPFCILLNISNREKGG